MNDIRTAVRRALGRARRLPTRLARAGHRPLAALAIAAAVLTTPLVPPTAARAEAPIDSAIRLQVVLKKVHIFNDHDWGAGELKLYAGFYAGDGVVAYDTPSIASMSRAAFSANSGDDVALERVFPWEGDT